MGKSSHADGNVPQRNKSSNTTSQNGAGIVSNGIGTHYGLSGPDLLNEYTQNEIGMKPKIVAHLIHRQRHKSASRDSLTPIQTAFLPMKQLDGSPVSH